MFCAVWDNPYAVALVNNCVEVRVLDQSGSNKDTFIQTISELSKARLLIRAKKGLLFAASVTQLWSIEMVDIGKQTNTLLKQNKFQLALQLTVSTYSLCELFLSQCIFHLRQDCETELALLLNSRTFPTKVQTISKRKFMKYRLYMPSIYLPTNHFETR